MSIRVTSRRTGAGLVAMSLAMLFLGLGIGPASATAPARPDASFETSHLTSTMKRIRIVVPSVPAGVVKYTITNKASGALVKTCKATQMPNGSGSSGCYIDRSNSYTATWYLRAWNSAGQASGITTGLIFQMTNADGTTNLTWVNGSPSQAARVSKDSLAVIKANGSGCLTDTGVKYAFTLLNKLGSTAMSKPNPYVFAAGLAAKGVAYMYTKSGIKNRCSAVGKFLRNIADQSWAAHRDGTLKFVLSGSDFNTDGMDTCFITTSGYTISTNPDVMGGPNRSECWSFWGALVS